MGQTKHEGLQPIEYASKNALRHVTRLAQNMVGYPLLKVTFLPYKNSLAQLRNTICLGQLAYLVHQSISPLFSVVLSSKWLISFS